MLFSQKEEAECVFNTVEPRTQILPVCDDPTTPTWHLQHKRKIQLTSPTTNRSENPPTGTNSVSQLNMEHLLGHLFNTVSSMLAYLFTFFLMPFKEDWPDGSGYKLELHTIVSSLRDQPYYHLNLSPHDLCCIQIGLHKGVCGCQ